MRTSIFPIGRDGLVEEEEEEDETEAFATAGIAAEMDTSPDVCTPKYLGKPFSLCRLIKSSQLLADAPIPGVLNRHKTFCLPIGDPPTPSLNDKVFSLS